MTLLPAPAALPLVADRLRAPGVTGRPAIVLLDGRSGSGKSTFGRRLLDRVPDAALLRLDDVYPGWDGLEQGSAQVLRSVLEPLSAGAAASWRRHDWVTGLPAERVAVDPGRPLVIEGAGALSRANRRLATFAAWIELDAPARYERAMARDGETYAPHWERWAAQEEDFAAREHPARLADIRIDGRTMSE